MKQLILLFILLYLATDATFAQNVGIGNTAPASKLDVSGDLALREGSALLVAAGSNTLTLPAAKNSIYRLSGATGPFSIDSISAGNDGMLLTLINTTGQILTVHNGSIQTGTGGDLTGSSVSGIVNLIYNAGLSAWLVVSGEGFGGTGTGINIYNSDGTLTSNRTVTMGTDNLNFNSTSGNFNYATTGAANVAMGNGLTVTGTNNFVTGTDNTAGGLYTTVGGHSNSYPGGYAGAVFGTSNKVSAGASNVGVFGDHNVASGNNVFVTGYMDTVTGTYSMANGQQNTVTGSNSFATGKSNLLSGTSSLASGSYNSVGGITSLVSGFYNNVPANYALVAGYQNYDQGDYSVALNLQNTISTGAYASIVGGAVSNVSSQLGVAIGYLDSVSGQVATALGEGNKAASYAEVVMGTYATKYTPANATGPNGADRAFNIGNGTGNTSRSDAFTVLKNGNVGIGNSTPTSRLQVNGTTSTNNLQMTNGAASGYVLQSDASGNASWVSPNTLSVTPITTNILSLAGSSLTSMVNGISSNPVDIASAVHNIYNADDTLTSNRTVGMGADNLTFSSTTGKLIFNTVNGSVALGKGNSVGTFAGAFGFFNTASGSGSVALGYGNQATAPYSMAMGSGSKAISYNEISLGIGNTSYSPICTSCWAGADRLFGIGNGFNTPSDAMVILKNGNTGFGTSTPSNRLEVAGKTKTTDFQMTNGAASGYVLQSDASGNASWVSPLSLGSSGWALTGNSGTTAGTHFIGTTDNKPLELRVNNIRAGYIENPSGQANTGLGYQTLSANTGNNNVAIGNAALSANTSGGRNTAIGSGALASNTTASFNTAVGWEAQNKATTANNNVSLGHYTLHNDTSGVGNVVIGAAAMPANYNGSQNTVLGCNSGANNLGSGNVFIGSQTAYNETGSNKLYIDNSNTTTPLIYGDFVNNHITINDSLTAKYLQVKNGAAAGYLMQSDASGNASWVSPSMITPATTNTLSNTTNTITSTINGVSATAPAVTAVSNTSTANSLSTVVNGVSGTAVPIVNSNTLTLTGTTVTSTVNGVASNALDIASVSSNIYNSDGALTSNRTVTMGPDNINFSSTTGNFNYNTSGAGNVTMGNTLTNTGANAFATGYNNTVSGANAFATGNTNTVSGNNAFATGQSNNATGVYTFASGSENIVSGSNAFATGNRNNVSGNTAIVGGRQNTVSGWYAAVAGQNNLAQGDGCAVFGAFNSGVAGKTLVTGYTDTAYGSQGVSMGIGNTSESWSEMAVGTYGTFYRPASTTVFSPSDRLFNIGNGTSPSSRSDALTILKSGNVGIGNSSPASKLQVNGKTTTTDLQMTAGAISGYLLQSDTSGNASWVSPSSITTATTNTLSNTANTITSTVNGMIATAPAINTNTLSLSGSSLTSTVNGVASNALDLSTVINNAWGLNGNSGTTSSNFIGTIDSIPLNFNTNNSRVGYLPSSSTGNILFGKASLPGGTNAIIIGNGAGNAGQTGTYNMAIGNSALSTAGPGIQNIALGNSALQANTSGSYNIGEGYFALSHNTMGMYNVAVGAVSQYSNESSIYNTSLGSGSMRSDSIGDANVAIGGLSLYADKAGDFNVAVGMQSGYSALGSNNVFLGYQAGFNETGSNKLYIDNSNSSTPLLYGDFANNHLTVNDSLTAKYLQVTSGAGAGYVMMSDAAGNASWANPSLNLANLYNSNGSLTGSRTVTQAANNLTFSSTTGNLIFNPSSTGKVGIGVTSPTANLDVVTTATGSFIPVAHFFAPGNTAANNVTEMRLGVAAANYNCAEMRFGYSASGSSSNYMQLGLYGTTGIAVKGNGFLGVNTTNPGYPLDIEQTTGASFGSYGYLNGSGNTGSGNSGGTQPYSVYASGRIAATEFDAYSDARIKKDRTASDPQQDLNTLMSLKPVEFRYIDSVQHGKDLKKGFIAQEVQQVYPQAVQTAPDFIPSVYQISAALQYDESTRGMHITVAKPHGLKTGDKVKTLTEKSGKVINTVTAIYSDTEFALGDWTDTTVSSVFVFGKEVSDFHTVDYDRIYTLNVSATQELAKRLMAAEKANLDLRSKLESAVSELHTTKADASEVQNLKAEIETLKSIVMPTTSK